jgi:hypothetical protein
MVIGDHESRRGIGSVLGSLAIAISRRDIIPGHASDGSRRAGDQPPRCAVST